MEILSVDDNIYTASLQISFCISDFDDAQDFLPIPYALNTKGIVTDCAKNS